jgi:hypothetical protein
MHPKPIGPPSNIQTNQAYPLPHIIGLTMICTTCQRSTKDNEHGERGKTPLEMRGQVFPLVGHASQTNWAPIQHPNQPSLPSTTHHWTYYDMYNMSKKYKRHFAWRMGKDSTRDEGPSVLTSGACIPNQLGPHPTSKPTKPTLYHTSLDLL